MVFKGSFYHFKYFLITYRIKTTVYYRKPYWLISFTRDSQIVDLSLTDIFFHTLFFIFLNSCNSHQRPSLVIHFLAYRCLSISQHSCIPFCLNLFSLFPSASSILLSSHNSISVRKKELCCVVLYRVCCLSLSGCFYKPCNTETV